MERPALRKKSSEKGVPATDRKRPETVSAETETDYQSTEFLTSIFDALDDGISIHAITGEVLYANNRMLEILGKAARDVIGNNCANVFHDEVCPHETVTATGVQRRLEISSKDGKSVFQVTVSPIKNRLGNTSGFIRVVHDISEAERTQEKLIKAEHFATLGQMASGIAHDVGTPLNIISGYSEYLLMRTGPEGQGRKELSAIIQQTRRIADFIKHMLDLSRPAQGRRDAIELKSFLADSLELIGSHLRKADVKAVLTCHAAPSLIYGDGPRLRQAIFNLLMNAGQYLGQGGEIEIAITESTARPDQIPVFILGTEKSGEAHDFSRSFSSLLSSGQTREGIGMGLSLTREILREFGASLDSTAVEGRGVALVLQLPKGKSAQPSPR
ncbi:MAG: PAS domain S-box protein [Blastocatellia bacterium]